MIDFGLKIPYEDKIYVLGNKYLVDGLQNYSGKKYKGFGQLLYDYKKCGFYLYDEDMKKIMVGGGSSTPSKHATIYHLYNIGV